MPLTTLDQKPALVVIDLQQGLRDIPTVHPLADIIDRAARLAAAFRNHQLPVVLVNATGRAPGRRDPVVHANSVDRIFPKLGERATTSEILDLLRG
jgi:nicotinamidase-related amidase